MSDEKKPVDLERAVDNMISGMENRLTKFGRSVLHSEKSHAPLRLANDAYQKFQETINDRMEKNLNWLSMASKADIDGLGERIHEVNERLIEVEKLLKMIVNQDQRGAPTGPPRTKKAPSRAKSAKSPAVRARKSASRTR